MSRSQTTISNRSRGRAISGQRRRERCRHQRLTRHARRAKWRRIRWQRAPWWQKFPLQLIALESHLAAEYHGFVRWRVGDALLYGGEVEVPETGTIRRLTLIFSRAPARWSPIVMADGPVASRHRYRWARPSTLCMWFPRDPDSLRWTLDKGLTGLIDRARVHLLREAWWRMTRRWPAPEIHRPASRPKDMLTPAEARRHERQRCWCGRGRYASCHGAIDSAQERRLLCLA